MNRTALRIRLSAAILQTHGVQAQWVTSTPIQEKAKGATAWRGDVETFELVRHPEAKYCYAWAQDMGENSELIMVLKIPPVNSALDAVREYVAKRRSSAKK
jgi:hypothetical protein